MTQHWRLCPGYDTPALREAFGSLDAVFALEGERITGDPLSEVLRVTVDGTRYYVKRYHRAAKNPLRSWVGRPRIQAEWENLLTFQAWGIRTADIAGYGLERRAGTFFRGALITKEIPGSIDLAQLANARDPRLHDRNWLMPVIRQVAAATRTMHEHRFAHNDLKWRNLLVDDGTPPLVYLIDCPAGGSWSGAMLRRRVMKDLACLDKVAHHVLSRTWRLRFFLAYRGRDRLTADDKPLLRQVLAYFEGRE
ncbi:lipopolysaccharide kinase InaA family protein [Thauera butanivorans]|uniref:lipopolysaccharide kinase InaA family protein n=1 Tax=Thauera butanivorans TaxID=86174 RepID=UPI0008397A45|nr:lipopolysaccharide kinase InaA family protein [Thauera butanivorans]